MATDPLPTEQDVAWYNARLANARLHNSALEQRIAALRAALADIGSGEIGINICVREARNAVAQDDEAARAGAERVT